MSYENPILVRRTDEAMIGGVCAGIAQRSGLDVSLVRIAYVIISIASAAFPGTVVYLLMWAIMPDEMGRKARGPWLWLALFLAVPVILVGIWIMAMFGWMGFSFTPW